jgi:hypothetical protein
VLRNEVEEVNCNMIVFIVISQCAVEFCGYSNYECHEGFVFVQIYGYKVNVCIFLYFGLLGYGTFGLVDGYQHFREEYFHHLQG